MLKGKYVLLSLATALLCWQAAGTSTVNSGIIHACSSFVSANAGIVLVCPVGDGDPLSATASGTNSTINATIIDGTGAPVVGIPVSDMWLAGCTGGLLLCGGSSGSPADVPTNGSGQTFFTGEPVAGGCDTGLYVVVQGTVIQDEDCLDDCLPIQARSPDYKSAGAPGPAPCAGDLKCPDSKVSNADFSWFVTHYTVNVMFPKPYHVCADYASSFGAITLADFTKFVFHFAGAGHKCPI